VSKLTLIAHNLPEGSQERIVLNKIARAIAACADCIKELAKVNAKLTR